MPAPGVRPPRRRGGARTGGPEPPGAGDWTPARAERLARDAGIPALGDLHWRVIAAYREDTARLGRAPRMARVLQLTGLDVGGLRCLFPGDPEAMIGRIAGLTTARPRGGDGGSSPDRRTRS
jgi:sulfur relay (sulfurtransferase) DsrC/TusE family protein